MTTKRLTLTEHIRQEQDFIASTRYEGYEDNEAVRRADLDKLHRLEEARRQGHTYLPKDFFTNPDKYRRA